MSIFVVLAVLVVLSLQDSLLGLSLTYLMFALGTEQFIRNGEKDAHYILVLTSASVMLVTIVLVGVGSQSIFRLSELTYLGAAN